MTPTKTHELARDVMASFAAPLGSAASGEPLMPYDDWRALGSEKAAEYLAKRRGYSAARQGKLWAILETAWGEMPPNDSSSATGRK